MNNISYNETTMSKKKGHLREVKPKEESPLRVVLRRPAPAAKSLSERRPCVMLNHKDRLRNRNSKAAQQKLRQDMEA